MHEAGHAVAAIACGLSDEVSITLVARGDLGALTRTRIENGTMQDRRALAVRLMVLLAGRAAEILVFGGPSTAAGGTAGSDLARATALAAGMAGSFGLDTHAPPVWLGSPDEALPLLFDPALRAFVEEEIREAEADALRLLGRHRGALGRIAEVLMTRADLSGRELRALIAEEEIEGDPEATT